MKLNEDSYLYIHQVAEQIEKLTCALISFIENVGSDLESYHYEAFNKFSNEIRDMEIILSKEINDEFIDIKGAIEKSAVIIRASENSVNELKIQLLKTEDVFSRLVIHSQNIREFNSDTTNPYVPNATDEVYRAFSGYKNLLEQYQVKKPDEDDPICTIMYSFFCTVKSLFESLFRKYDCLLQEFGVEVEEKKKNIAELTIIKKHEGRNKIAKASFNVAKTAVFSKLGIKEKSAVDMVESAISLVATISDTLDELDEVKYAKPKKSLARKVIKKIAIYNDALELVDGTNEIVEEVAGIRKTFIRNDGVKFEIPTLEKFVVALGITSKNASDIEKWKESGEFDVATANLNVAKSVMDIGMAIVSRDAYSIIKGVPDLGLNILDVVDEEWKESEEFDVATVNLNVTKSVTDIGMAIVSRDAYSIIKGVPDLGFNVLDLVEKTSIYLKKNKKHIKPKAVDKVLYKLGAQLAKYNDEVEQYKIDKEKKLLAVKKPKAPPFIIAKEIFKNIKEHMDFFED